MSGTFQIADQARIFGGNNIETTSETAITIVEETAIISDVANNRRNPITDEVQTNKSVTVTSYSAGLISASSDSGAGDLDFYPGAMVLYTSTSAAASGLVNNTTYFIDTVFQQGTSANYSFTIKPLPDQPTITSISGGIGTQKFSAIGISLDKDIVHVRDSSFTRNDLLKYEYPVGGHFGSSDTKDYYFVGKVYDTHNYQLEPQFVPDGLTSATPGVSAAQLKTDWGYNTDGVYWITVNNRPEQVYCIMNSLLDGGGWMMAMKGTRGTTFNYNSSYWQFNNTLNDSQINRNDGDAKFNVYNQWQAKDMLALWPDIGQGGSISAAGYPWVWLQNNFFAGTRTTPLTFFQSVGAASNQVMNPGGRGYYIQDAATFAGKGSAFSGQTDIRFYGYNYENNLTSGLNARVRWGFGWNENGEGLYPSGVVGPQGSNDVSGGIGMDVGFGNYSAGDRINCCQNSTGINRSARFEMYVR
jgi:hypothetical protein